MVLKGLPQARLLYSDPAYRSSSDIDILVSPRDFRRAAGVLEAAGFAPANPPVSASSPYAFAFYGVLRDASFRNAKIPGAYIELHQRPFFATGLRAQSLRLVAERPSSSKDIPAPAIGPDLAFYLIAHGALSYWARLKWLADLVPLFAKLPDADKSRIIENAEASVPRSPLPPAYCLLDALFPFAAVGPIRHWLEQMQNIAGVRTRLGIYARTIGVSSLEGNWAQGSRWITLKTWWSFFEAPSTRGRILVFGPIFLITENTHHIAYADQGAATAAAETAHQSRLKASDIGAAAFGQSGCGNLRKNAVFATLLAAAFPSVALAASSFPSTNLVSKY